MRSGTGLWEGYAGCGVCVALGAAGTDGPGLPSPESAGALPSPAHDGSCIWAERGLY